MKIYTRVDLIWDKELGQYVEESSESFEYEGVVAEAKGGGSETTKTEPWAEQAPYLKDLFQQAQNWQQQGPADLSGSTGLYQQQIGGIGQTQNLLGQVNPAISQAQDLNQQAIAGTQAASGQMTDLAGQMSGIGAGVQGLSGQVGADAGSMRDTAGTVQGYAPGVIQNAQDTQGAMTPYLQSMMSANQKMGDGSLMDVNANPALQGYIESMNDQIMKQYSEGVMPGITSGAAQVGGIGSSRQAIAQGAAADAALSSVGRNTAGMLSTAYGQGMQGTLAAQGMAPGFTQAGSNLGMLTNDATALAAQLQGQGAGLMQGAAGLEGMRSNMAGLQGSLLDREAGLRSDAAKYDEIAATQGLRGVDIAGMPAQVQEQIANLYGTQAGLTRGIETQYDAAQLERLTAYQNLIGGGYGGTQTGPSTESGGLSGAVGGAAAGATAGNMMVPGGTGAMWGGAIGGIAGFFS